MNTGRKIYTTLIEVNATNGSPTGRSKPNIIGDPDYIAPTTNITMCPIGNTPPPQPTTTTTTTTVGVRSFVCNLTNLEICPASMCITGNEHLVTLYARVNSFGLGAQLYYDPSLTNLVTDQKWVRKSTELTIYALSLDGIILEEGSLTCPI